MKILKNGNIPSVRFLCYNCGCVFIAEAGEYKYSNIFGDELATCACPKCRFILHKDIERHKVKIRINGQISTYCDKLQHY